MNMIIWKNFKDLMFNIKNCLKGLFKLNININLHINNYKDCANYIFFNNENKKYSHNKE